MEWESDTCMHFDAYKLCIDVYAKAETRESCKHKRIELVLILNSETAPSLTQSCKREKDIKLFECPSIISSRGQREFTFNVFHNT